MGWIASELQVALEVTPITPPVVRMNQTMHWHLLTQHPSIAKWYFCLGWCNAVLPWCQSLNLWDPRCLLEFVINGTSQRTAKKKWSWLHLHAFSLYHYFLQKEKAREWEEHMCSSSSDTKDSFGAGHDTLLLSGLSVKDPFLTGVRSCCIKLPYGARGFPWNTEEEWVCSSLLCCLHTFQSREERTSPADKDRKLDSRCTQEQISLIQSTTRNFLQTWAIHGSLSKKCDVILP